MMGCLFMKASGSGQLPHGKARRVGGLGLNCQGAFNLREAEAPFMRVSGSPDRAAFGASRAGRGARYPTCSANTARLITSCWISLVPS
jgi:hypothetical protein